MRSNSWNLGTCVPGAVIEYLSTKQTQIVHLEVITDTTCLGLDYFNIYDLYGFKKLRRLRLIIVYLYSGPGILPWRIIPKQRFDIRGNRD